MSTTMTIFLMFIVVEATIIVAFFIVAKYLDLLTKQIDATRKLYSDSFEKLIAAYDGLRAVDNYRQEVYKKIIEADEGMTETLNKAFEIDHKIIETWKEIEERYSAVYEEYRHCIDKLEGLDKASVDIYAKLLVLEEYTKPIEISTELSVDDMDWDPFEDPFDDDDFWEEKDEQESDESRRDISAWDQFDDGTDSWEEKDEQESDET